MAKKKSDDLRSMLEELQIEEKIDDTFSFISVLENLCKQIQCDTGSGNNSENKIKSI